MSDTRPPLDVEALVDAIQRVRFDNTDPDGSPDYIGPDWGWEWYATSREMADAIAAAYQPAGPDDLAGLLHESYGGDAGCFHTPEEEPQSLCEQTAAYLTARGVTLTGVRSSEDWRSGYDDWKLPGPGVRSSEVDGLRQRLARIEGLAWSDTYHALREEGVAEDRAMAHADIVRNALTDRIAAALTGDSGPKVEPEP